MLSLLKTCYLHHFLKNLRIPTIPLSCHDSKISFIGGEDGDIVLASNYLHFFISDIQYSLYLKHKYRGLGDIS